MKTARNYVPVSRNDAEPAPRWLSHYIITVRVVYFVAYTLDWPQLHVSMHWHKHCLFALETSCPVFFFVFVVENASSFDKQVDSVEEHLTRTQTDAHAVIVCLWPGYIKNVTVTRTQQKLPPLNKAATSLAKTQLHIAGFPEKARSFFHGDLPMYSRGRVRVRSKNRFARNIWGSRAVAAFVRPDGWLRSNKKKTSRKLASSSFRRWFSFRNRCREVEVMARRS